MHAIRSNHVACAPLYFHLNVVESPAAGRRAWALGLGWCVAWAGSLPARVHHLCRIGLDGARRGGVRLRVRARGVVVDGYEALRVDHSNVYAQLGASSSQPGPGKR